jgi:hypothetical protein
MRIGCLSLSASARLVMGSNPEIGIETVFSPRRKAKASVATPLLQYPQIFTVVVTFVKFAHFFGDSLVVIIN